MITPSTMSIIILATATILAIIGYFLKIVHTDVRKVIEDQGKLKGKIELVEQEGRLKYQAIQEQTQLELKNLTKSVCTLSDTVNKLLLSER
jgi:hypothetical protein